MPPNKAISNIIDFVTKYFAWLQAAINAVVEWEKLSMLPNDSKIVDIKFEEVEWEVAQMSKTIFHVLSTPGAGSPFSANAALACSMTPAIPMDLPQFVEPKVFDAFKERVDKSSIHLAIVRDTVTTCLTSIRERVCTSLAKEQASAPCGAAERLLVSTNGKVTPIF